VLPAREPAVEEVGDRGDAVDDRGPEVRARRALGEQPEHHRDEQDAEEGQQVREVDRVLPKARSPLLDRGAADRLAARLVAVRHVTSTTPWPRKASFAPAGEGSGT